ncbi:hypothetical protein EKG83_44155 [Saccharothrix syringae]|uniref:Uncharacterized protein n=1 Tax=Saccharothrix syringae TaxID=103733 RepID=A0A5Q0HC79_SACSY|nr:hypothetical protein EKG83_44155 [Saccharothrix syringae]
MARFDLTEPHVPVATTGPLPRRVREQFNGILWRFRTGSGWNWWSWTPRSCGRITKRKKGLRRPRRTRPVRPGHPLRQVTEGL